MALLAVVVFLASLPAYFEHLQIACTDAPCADRQLTAVDVQALQALGLSVHAYAAFAVAHAPFSASVSCGVAALIFWRRSDERLALFVALMLVTFGTTRNWALLVAAGSIWGWPGLVLSFIGSISLIPFFYVFPDGRFVPRWTRWLAGVWIAEQVLEYFLPDLAVTQFLRSPETGIWFFASVWVITLAAQLYRYVRVSGPVQRQQTKWLVLGLASLVVVLLGLVLPMLLFPALAQPGSLYPLTFAFALDTVGLLIPLSIGLAILRYRLWEVDVLIRRTLIYGTLTGVLALVYLGGVVLLQSLFRALTSQESNLAIVAATLAAAALFQPLRQRVQATIDRRFYRRKYDAAQTLAAFSARLRDEVDLATLTNELVRVVDDTMQPSHVSLWLRLPSRPRFGSGYSSYQQR